MTELAFRGRFAPTPSGALHLGSLVAAVASYLHARAAGGQWLVRVEDVDETRCVAGAQQSILDCLSAHALVWDGAVTRQSDNHERYEQALRRLDDDGALYRCGCTRKIRMQNVVCRCRAYPPKSGSVVALKLARAPEFAGGFVDEVCGRIDDVVAAGGAGGAADVIVRRSDGQVAYLFATAVDDAVENMTWVVRGADLLDSTARQISIQKHLGMRSPQYAHHPLALGADGRKLSKQNRAPELNWGEAVGNLRAAFAVLKLDAPAGIGTAPALLEWGREAFCLERLAGAH